MADYDWDLGTPDFPPSNRELADKIESLEKLVDKLLDRVSRLEAWNRPIG